MAILAILAIYGPCGHNQQFYRYARYGYPGKEHKNTNPTVLISAQLDIPLKSYDCFTILGQIYILRMAIFDRFYHHRNNGATEILNILMEMAWHGDKNGRVYDT